MCVCAALAALATVTLWPSWSFAAILPACEYDYASTAAPPADPAPEASCEDVRDTDEIDNSRAAPICDSRGASAVAPPRIRGVPDIRFEGGRPCDTKDSLRAAVSPGRGDPPAQAPDTIVERVDLPTVDMVSPPAESRLIDPLAPADGPREGVRLDVYHPPR